MHLMKLVRSSWEKNPLSFLGYLSFQLFWPFQIRVSVGRGSDICRRTHESLCIVHQSSFEAVLCCVMEIRSSNGNERPVGGE